MKILIINQNRQLGIAGFWSGWSGLSLLVMCLLFTASSAPAQNGGEQTVTRRIQQLTDAMTRVQAQVEDSERQLAIMKKQLEELQMEMAQGRKYPAAGQQTPELASESVSASLTAAVNDLREQEAVTESQIATHEQDKVESESKYPVRITGMLLLNAFANQGAVDVPATPTMALPGSGNAGASLRQTVVGVDAEGPHLFGARSYADLRADFYGSTGTSSGESSASYYNYTAPLRLRTAHAGLQWDQVEAYFSLDRPILSPNAPDSLTAVAVPALAWSGNLWTWNPQAGVNGYFRGINARGLELQAALIDTADAPLTVQASSSNSAGSTSIPASNAEQSSRPGVEARIAALGSMHNEDRDDIGVGGYFAPHHSALDGGYDYDSWAATFDERLLLPARLQLTGNVYRGSALGGLGAGGYKDFAYDQTNTGKYYFRALDDAGGWAQLKERFSERLEANGAFGIDNVFARQLRPYFLPTDPLVYNLARNRTYTGNVIYSPSTYLLFSFEYRHIESVPVTGDAAISNIFGVAAGYKF